MQNLYIHAFNLALKSNRRALKKIEKSFKDFQYAWEKADAIDFLSAGLDEEMILRIIENRRIIDIEKEYKWLCKNKIKLISYGDAEYPIGLNRLKDPPFLLYQKGAELSTFKRKIAVVGTRKPSDYGVKQAELMVKQLVQCGVVPVSGLAFGIDAVVHNQVIKMKQPTIAILGSGVNCVTPVDHQYMADQIIAYGGALISEYSCNESADKYRFLERNGIIAGLCSSTIVIEAGLKSGALSTANWTNKLEGSSLFALPGDIDRAQACGCMSLIEKNQASCITSVDSLLKRLGLESTAEQLSMLRLTDNQKVLFGLINQGLSKNEVFVRSGLIIGDFNVAWSELEMEGLIDERYD